MVLLHLLLILAVVAAPAGIVLGHPPGQAQHGLAA
jgi:hypothetical protein